MNYPFGQIDDQSTEMTVKMSAIPTIGFQFSVLSVLSLQRKLRANEIQAKKWSQQQKEMGK